MRVSQHIYAFLPAGRLSQIIEEKTGVIYREIDVGSEKKMVWHIWLYRIEAWFLTCGTAWPKQQFTTIHTKMIRRTILRSILPGGTVVLRCFFLEPPLHTTPLSSWHGHSQPSNCFKATDFEGIVVSAKAQIWPPPTDFRKQSVCCYKQHVPVNVERLMGLITKEKEK